MVGLGKGGAGVLGLRAFFLELVLDCVRSRKKRVRLDNCIVSIVSLVTGLAGLGREIWNSGITFHIRSLIVFRVGKGGTDWTNARFLLYRYYGSGLGGVRGGTDWTTARFVLYH